MHTSYDQKCPMNPWICIEHRSRYKWEKALREIVVQNPKDKPEKIYKDFLLEVPEENKQSIPDKDIIKKRITSIKSGIRRKVLRSIVSS